MGIQITGRVFCSLWAGTEAPSTSVTTPLRGDSGWPVPPPVAQTLCLGDARSFFMSTFISHHLFFTSATLRPSEATAFTLCATCCHSRAFSASVTRPNAVHQIIQPSSSPPPRQELPPHTEWNCASSLCLRHGSGLSLSDIGLLYLFIHSFMYFSSMFAFCTGLLFHPLLDSDILITVGLPASLLFHF